MNFTIVYDRESDGRWIAEIKDIPGVLVYGNTFDEAASKVKALALRVLADKFEQMELKESKISIEFQEA